MLLTISKKRPKYLLKPGENGLFPIIQDGKFIQCKFLYMVTKKIRFARHSTLVFLLYDVVNRCTPTHALRALVNTDHATEF